MAQWIRVTEESVITTTVSPKNGTSFTLPELQQLVGGYVEALQLEDGLVLWFNEEGKLHDLPMNPPATLLALGAGIAPNDYIGGNAVITTRAEAGEDQEEED